MCQERCFGIEPFEPYDHEGAALDLEAERDAADAAGIVAWFDCDRCNGHGCYMDRKTNEPVKCAGCNGRGRRGATEDDLYEASAIGSSNPFCRHEWAINEESDRSYCMRCGADGDA